jgi:putative pyruvate formate lyase activating enzyme
LKYSQAEDYFQWAGRAVEEMYCQQPKLALDDSGAALSGLIIRHLVLPGSVYDSIAVLRWIAGRLSPFVPLSLMSQYQPRFLASGKLLRKPSPHEYRRVLREAEKLGFEEVFAQPASYGERINCLPDFDKKDPFRWR